LNNSYILSILVTMGVASCCKVFLSFLLIVLNAIGLILGLALLGLSVWQWLEFSRDPLVYETFFGTESREILIFFMAATVSLTFICIVGIVSGVLSLIEKLRYLAGILLLLYMAALLAAYTLEIVTITLNYASFYYALTTLPGTLSSAVLTFPYNDTSKPETRAIIFIQQVGQCCGWESHYNYSSSPAAINVGDSTWRPLSCCSNTTYPICWANRTDLYTEPCGPKYGQYVVNVGFSIIGMGIGVAVVELLVLIIPLFLLVLVCRPVAVTIEKM
ncbi:hypothetical protein, partial [Salmonella sp. s54836]|uniref:hypothetical protein n=1 Tax=Salmonella sp. s54836 TaxID=3159673 RepID=UPI00397FBEFB